MPEQPPDYITLLTQGPFPNRIDPWAEVGYYFQQIHSGMIHELLEQLQPRLLPRGYVAGREASLQIAEGREPDIYVQRSMDAPPRTFDYDLAAAEVLAQPGIALETDYQTGAIHIRQSGRLVTVVEIVSPNNKTKPDAIRDYQQRREQLIVERGVHVVEIDLTRSVKRLIHAEEASQYPYHVIIHLAGDSPRFIGIHDQLPRIALPLNEDVVPLELEPAYRTAYRVASIAAQIHTNGHYTEAQLSLPSLMPDSDALDRVRRWQASLGR